MTNYIPQSVGSSYRSLVHKFCRRDMITQRHFSRSVPLALKYEADRFKGITVDLTNQMLDRHTFPGKLQVSLRNWEGYGCRCVWFKVGIKQAFFIPILAEEKFNFHHARNDYVMMYRWLPRGVKPNLPPSVHTNLGVGAMVFNDKCQILAISEKHYDYPHLKLPGGYVEHGENLIDAAIREVKEETGIDCEFESLVTFRHNHNMMFGNSDIYVLLRMNARSDNIKKGEREVMECKWMELDDYLHHPNVHQWNRDVVKKAMQYKRRGLILNIKHEVVKWASNIRDTNYLVVEDEG